jgi:UDP-glucose:(heptosyl)LPS alpha-1,3-glucosyltransferase
MPDIAVVIPKYGLVGGAEQFAAELTGQLCNRTAYTFQVFANRWESNSGVISFQKIPIYSFPKFLTTLSFAWFVERRIKRGHFDLVHSHERIFAADIYTLHGIPHRWWISHIRQKKAMSLYDAATAWVEKKLVMESGCKKFIAVSELTRQIFLSEYAVNPDRVAVIHPGVHLPDDPLSGQSDIRDSVRRELGIACDDPVIVFASMNFEIKGLDDILSSLAQVRRQHNHFKLIVAGKGNVKKYQKLAADAGVADHVIFTGVVGRERMNDLYRAGDLYVMLSRFDTFGMVVLEAMSAGLPVIVSSHVGAKDLVEEG